MIAHCGRCPTTEQNTLSITVARLLLAYFHRGFSVQGFLWEREMKFNELPSQIYLWECFSYDPKTGLLTRKVRPKKHFGTIANWKRSKTSVGNAIQTRNSSGYVVTAINGKQYYAHRLIWKMVYGRAPYDQIDHINRNKSDNRLANLREATSHSNSVNRRTLCTNKSGVTGVFWNKWRGKWASYIYVNTKYRDLGCFETKEEAIAQRKKAESDFGFDQWNKEHGTFCPH